VLVVTVRNTDRATKRLCKQLKVDSPCIAHAIEEGLRGSDELTLQERQAWGSSVVDVMRCWQAACNEGAMLLWLSMLVSLEENIGHISEAVFISEPGNMINLCKNATRHFLVTCTCSAKTDTLSSHCNGPKLPTV
jgi:hypothetical protein